LLLGVKSENTISAIMVQSADGTVLSQSTVQPTRPLADPKYRVTFALSETVAFKLAFSLG